MNGILKRLLMPQGREYIAISPNWLIQEKSSGVSRFADSPEQLKWGRDVREFFPELRGLETVISEIFQGKKISYEVKALSRSCNFPLYFDLYFLLDHLNENQLIILVEDATERLQLVQQLTQTMNEYRLLLEERDRLLNAIAQQIHRSLKLEDILRINVKEIRQQLACSRVLVYYIYPHQFQWGGRVISESILPGCLSLLENDADDLTVKRNWSNFNLTDTIYQSNNRTVDETDPITKEQLEEYQIASEVILPIWIRALDSEAVFQTYLWGLLVVHHQTPRQWKQREIDILKQFADYLTISIQLEQLAVVDYLTRLSNRRYFNSKIQQEWRRLSREEKTLSLILCDVDHFSSYNKTYGHLAGDECLKKIAGVLTNFARRPADLVARYGGEEFALILPNTELQGAMKVAENIRSQVRALGIENANSSYGYVTISIGVACQIPNRNFPPDILIQAADEAMFQAKKNGRDRVYCEAIQG